MGLRSDVGVGRVCGPSTCVTLGVFKGSRSGGYPHQGLVEFVHGFQELHDHVVLHLQAQTILHLQAGEDDPTFAGAYGPTFAGRDDPVGLNPVGCPSTPSYDKPSGAGVKSSMSGPAHGTHREIQF